ncbi:MAG: hypothetical protein ACTSRU_01805 [Candidatus Hodarchaeales archaeon]
MGKKKRVNEFGQNLNNVRVFWSPRSVTRIEKGLKEAGFETRRSHEKRSKYDDYPKGHGLYMDLPSSEKKRSSLSKLLKKLANW